MLYLTGSVDSPPTQQQDIDDEIWSYAGNRRFFIHKNSTPEDMTYACCITVEVIGATVRVQMEKVYLFSWHVII